MKKLLFIISAILILTSGNALSQVAPTAEPVYGGYIEDIAAIPISTTETRVFIATRSANAMFYTDITTSSSPPVFTSFHVVPDFDASTNMGYIRTLDADENSNFVFAAMENGGLYGCDITSGSISLIDSEFIEALKVYDGYLFYLKYKTGNLRLYVGTINPSTGAVTVSGSIVLASSPSWWPPRFNPQIEINPANNKVYVFIPGQPPVIMKTSDDYNSLSSSTTITSVAIADLVSSGREFCAFGIAPDGKLFAATYEGNTNSFTAYMYESVSDGDPWTANSISQDMGRGEFSIVGSGSNYVIYYSRIVSLDRGATWDYSMAADGAVAGDPYSVGFAYVRTDWGMGVVDVYNHVFQEINDGIQAVEVEAFAMNSGKSEAWVASKSGVWYVYDYDTPSPTWTSSPIWPLGDSMPFVSTKCDQTGTLVYMGNVGGKLYRFDKSTGLPVADPASYQLIFDATSAPGWTWTYGATVTAIGIDYASSTERIFAGIYDFEDWDETTEHQGGVFVGENSSGTWTWSQITSSAVIPDGIDVYDLISVTEAGNTVVYVGAEYNSSVTPTISGIYRMEETSAGVWNVTQDLYNSSGIQIYGTILDIAKSPYNVIYACGSNASGTAPIIVYKSVGGSSWTEATTSGLPATAREAKSITFHNNDIYVAIDNSIYVLYSGAASWSLYYSYPVGTDIKFIYYDDLLVGTGYGLFVHNENENSVEDNSSLPEKFVLYQNYPNPFNPVTTIKYSIPSVIASEPDLSGERSNLSNNSQNQQIVHGTLRATNLTSSNSRNDVNVQLIIYNILGEEVTTLVNERQTPGSYSVQFDASNLPSGIYFYTLRAGDFVAMKKMVLLK